MGNEKSAALYAARGLPLDLGAALLLLDEEGRYEPEATKALFECINRGLVERLEECGEDRRAVVTPFGRAVIEELSRSDSNSHPEGENRSEAEG